MKGCIALTIRAFSDFLPLLSSGDNINSMTDRDPSLDTLLELYGVMYAVDDTGCCWVKFEVARIDATQERPHGLRYSLTLHDEKGLARWGSITRSDPGRFRPGCQNANRVRP